MENAFALKMDTDLGARYIGDVDMATGFVNAYMLLPMTTFYLSRSEAERKASLVRSILLNNVTVIEVAFQEVTA